MRSEDIVKMEDEDVLKELSNISQILTNDYIIENKTINLEEKMIEVSEENTAVINVPVIKEVQAFKEIAIEWFKIQNGLQIKTKQNPKPLSPNTVREYNRYIMNVFNPYFESNKNVALITEGDAEKCLETIEGLTSRNRASMILRKILRYANEKEHTSVLINIEGTEQEIQCEEAEILHIESERQPFWLDKFEEEDTDFSLACQTLLTIGARPEERMWTKMDSSIRGNR